MGVLDIGSGRESWATEGLTVEYSPSVIAGICSLVREAGVVEIGGLLFGLRAGSRVRIEGFRPVRCEHSEGLDFALSAADRAGLEKTAQSARQQPDLKTFEAIGWYRSQRRGEIAFTERDRDLHDRYFRYPGQLAVIFRAGGGDCYARVYARETNGSIRGWQRHFPCPKAPDAVAPSPAVSAPPPRPEPDSPPAGPRTGPAIDEVASPWRIPWLRLAAGIAILLVLAATFALTKDYWFPPPAEPLALRAIDSDGQLLIEWDRSARPIREGKSATLDVVDGAERTTIPLNGAQLRQGNVSYSRKSDLVDLRLTITRSRFGTAQEYLRFVGQPVKNDRNELLEKLEQLRRDVAARDQQLRRLRAR